MSVIKAVVFDGAGTMIDFGCVAPVQALRAVFAAEGAPIGGPDARRDMGRAKRDHVRALLGYPEVRQAWSAAHGRAPDEGDVSRIHDALEPLMREAAMAHSELIAGAAEVARDLKARGVAIGSCTGYTRPMMAPILPLAAAQGYAPSVVICAGETLEGRPSPLMLWKALVELGAWPARACVKVDDAEVGIGEGRAAGAWTVGVSASGNGVGLSAADYAALPAGERRDRVDRSAAGLRAAGADFVIETVADLPGVLDQIDRRVAAGERPGA